MLAPDDEVENVQLQNFFAVVDQQHVTALHVQVDAVRHVLETTPKHVTATERCINIHAAVYILDDWLATMHSAMLIIYIRKIYIYTCGHD